MLPHLSQRIKRLSLARRLTFAAGYLPQSMPHFWETVADFANVGRAASNECITSDESRMYAENIRELDPAAFDSDSELTIELLGMPRGPRDATGYVLISPVEQCLNCSSTLHVRSDRFSQITVFDDTFGTFTATHYTKYCRKRGCSYQQHYGYHSFGNATEVFYEPSSLSQKYFISSRETAFSTDMLKKFDAEILIGQISYKQRADIYNYNHCYETSEAKCRVRLDRRCLEVAHIRRAIVTVSTWYPNDINLSSICFLQQLDETLSQLNSLYHDLFHKLYSSHRCSLPGCGHTLVIDGNMKIHRNVCAAKDAGFTRFDGLPGSVKTGCMNTPEQKGVFCEVHKVRGIHGDGVPPSLCLMITGHRATRTGVLYQVACIGEADSNTIWLPEEKVPPTVIDEYRKNVCVGIEEVVTSYSGQKVHTLQISRNQTSTNPAITEGNDGVFRDHPDDKKHLICNTEKDKHVRLHHRSAGILAGAWPCGIITLLGELYVAESKAQVYGFLHALISKNNKELSTLRYICYDDGCHLKRFAENSVRSDVSAIAKFIAQLHIVIDRMHFKGHIDEWCKQNCNPDSFSDLDNVDTEVCEQTFSWLSRYSHIFRHMNKERFLFYLLYLCDCHNRRKLLTVCT